MKEIQTNGYIKILAHRQRWQGSKPEPQKILPFVILATGSQKFEKYRDHVIASKAGTKIT